MPDITTQSAPAGAATTGQTVAPEQQTAGIAQPQEGATQAAGDQSQGADGEGKEPLTPEQRTIKKLERRIGNLTARSGGSAREAELARAEVQELRARLQQLEGSGQEDGKETRQQPGLTQADVERLANERAQELHHGSAVSAGLRKAFEAGAKLEAFDAALDALGDEIPLVDRRGRATPFLAAVLECCDSPAHVLHHLGNNPEEAAELNGLTPVQLGRRLAKLDDRLTQGAKNQTSSAPPPLKGVTPKSAPSKSLLDLSADDYAKARRKQIQGN
jgi:hypothetical protein